MHTFTVQSAVKYYFYFWYIVFVSVLANVSLFMFMMHISYILPLAKLLTTHIDTFASLILILEARSECSVIRKCYPFKCTGTQHPCICRQRIPTNRDI